MLDALAVAYHETMKGVKTPEHPKRWLEKTPNNYLRDRVARLAEWYPGAHFVHMVRDPRDIYVSYKKKHPWLPAWMFANGWRMAMRDGEHNQRAPGEQRYLIVRYEDLLRDTRPVLDRVTGFLGIDYDDVLLKPSKLGVPWEGNSMWDDRSTGLSTAPIGRHRGSDRVGELEVVEGVLAAEIARYGYEPHFQPDQKKVLVGRTLANYDLVRRRSQDMYRELHASVKRTVARG